MDIGKPIIGPHATVLVLLEVKNSESFYLFNIYHSFWNISQFPLVLQYIHTSIRLRMFDMVTETEY